MVRTHEHQLALSFFKSFQVCKRAEICTSSSFHLVSNDASFSVTQ